MSDDSSISVLPNNIAFVQDLRNDKVTMPFDFNRS